MTMQTITTIAELRQHIDNVRMQGKTVGFVPTMGFLHEGHLALVGQARQDNDIVVVSIFVNPLQFGPNEDFEAYPRDLNRDAELLRGAGCDILFAPSVDEMYPRPSATSVELPDLAASLCGASRPGHFRGVATVVSKLLHIVTPTRIYFGQKDGQQVAIIKRMVADLNIPVTVVTCKTIRESDGLAKSSRNVYLTEADRNHALALFQTLSAARSSLEAGVRDGRTLAQQMVTQLSAAPGIRLDYAEVVSLDTLRPIEGEIAGDIMLAVAAYVGKARLIDNFQLGVDGVQVVELTR